MKINFRNFPIIMPYLHHIVEQPIDGLYCSLLVSFKDEGAYNIYYSFLCTNVYHGV